METSSLSTSELLIETLAPNSACLAESQTGEGKEKKWYLEGIFMQTEKKNGNGRMYPKSVMEPAVKKLQERIEGGGAPVLGELEHPDTVSVRLDQVSHIIEGLWWNGNDIIGRAKILDTPKGAIVKALLKENINLGVSSRGTGSTRNNGEYILVESFNLVTVDIVATPSAPDAFPKSLLESYNAKIEEIYHNQTILTLAEATQNDKSAQKYFQKSVEQFLKGLNL